MTLDAEIRSDPNAPTTARDAHRLLLAWLVAGAVLLAGLGHSPVRRTQEARVLVTAREMISSREGLRGWLVPHLNGKVRLEKPPLAYWLAAASMKLFGVTEAAGRLPNAIAGWLTLAVTYLLARRAFGAQAALLSSATLLTSYMFFRHARLAETDVLATLFVTAAVHLIWQFVDEEFAARRRFLLAHASAAMIALAVLAKGPPALFAALFFVAYALIAHRPRRLWEWCLTGAPITGAIIALPWFLYIRALPEWPIIYEEMRAALAGRAHRGPFY